jgi:Tol biopolymer transport system component
MEAVSFGPSSTSPATSIGWAPDGKHLLFASDRSGSMILRALPFLE